MIVVLQLLLLAYYGVCACLCVRVHAYLWNILYMFKLLQTELNRELTNQLSVRPLLVRCPRSSVYYWLSLALPRRGAVEVLSCGMATVGFWLSHVVDAFHIKRAPGKMRRKCEWKWNAKRKEKQKQNKGEASHSHFMFLSIIVICYDSRVLRVSVCVCEGHA